MSDFSLAGLGWLRFSDETQEAYEERIKQLRQQQEQLPLVERVQLAKALLTQSCVEVRHVETRIRRALELLKEVR
jgi:hypothetical protein